MYAFYGKAQKSVQIIFVPAFTVPTVPPLHPLFPEMFCSEVSPDLSKVPFSRFGFHAPKQCWSEQDKENFLAKDRLPLFRRGRIAKAGLFDPASGNG
jgi:hypothetical protein